MIPVMYPFSRYFDIPSTAMVILKSVNIFIGTTSTLAIFVLELLAEEDKVQLSWWHNLYLDKSLNWKKWS
jgi:hypothetical protein